MSSRSPLTGSLPVLPDETQVTEFKHKLLAWGSRYNAFCLLDNNFCPHHDYECLAAAGALHEIACSPGEGVKCFEALRDFQPASWRFGFFSYDLKNENEDLASRNPDGIGFPGLYFFVPRHLVAIRQGRVEVLLSDRKAGDLLQDIRSTPLPGNGTPPERLHILSRMSKTEYLDKVRALQEHIRLGDLYEVNLCMEFFAENADVDPLPSFVRLNRAARAPFSCFFRMGERFLLCSSPERFLKKSGDRLLSQPIKGTAPRGRTKEEDDLLAARLRGSEKDRSENIMITDLVRNDLARSCMPGTVQVEELCGIHTFPLVHQMVSSIAGKLTPGTHPLDALRMAFPMGSMTGAPKVKAMELIEKYENTRRGLFSGAAGYITPGEDFDFNVVIRSILYNRENRYLSFQAGSAIVHESSPGQEYEECLLKARGMAEALGSQDNFFTSPEK